MKTRGSSVSPKTEARSEWYLRESEKPPSNQALMVKSRIEAKVIADAVFVTLREPLRGWYLFLEVGPGGGKSNHLFH